MCPEKENSMDERIEEGLTGSVEPADRNPGGEQTAASTADVPSERALTVSGEPDDGNLLQSEQPDAEESSAAGRGGRGNNALLDILKPGLMLTVITAVIALLLSVLNFTTKDIISEQLSAKKREAVASIFGGDIDAVLTPFEGEVSEPVREISLVTKNGKVLGFSVSVAPKGYAGEIEMLVGVNLDNTVKGVRIIEESETAGLGTKIRDEAFLHQFMWLVYEIKADGQDNSVDLISGATFSSRGVLDGVNAALERTLSIDIGAYVEQETDATPSESAQETTQATENQTEATQTETAQEATQ